MPTVPKYISVNGVMMKNPAYANSSGKQIPAKPPTAQPLAVICSAEDMMDASNVQLQATGLPIAQAASMESSTEILQDPELLAEFMSSTELDGGEILDKLGEEFAKYETPIGMINKLLSIKDRHLNFIIDDSGSMSSETDVALSDATTYVLRGRQAAAHVMMKRWEEAEDRLHIMIDLLAYIPTKPITMSFLNSNRILSFTREGKTPDEFKASAHAEIINAFTTLRPTNGTPSRRALTRAFATTNESSMHYFLTDGAPSDCTPEELAQLIINRRNPDKHALTLISCTNNDHDTDWMKLVDGRASFIAEVDDFNDEKAEVLKKQGPGFPYTKGLWILCHLAASIHPHDLDALDENLPLTKSTLDNVLGRQLSPAEYQYYFELNPNAALYVSEYSRFLNEPRFSRELISKTEQARRETNAGYHDGAPTRALPRIDRSLDEITRQATAGLQTETRAPAAASDANLVASLGMMAVKPPSYEASKSDASVFRMG